MRNRKTRSNTEGKIQQAIVNFLRTVGYDGRKGLVYSVPNESVGKIWGARMKAQGRLAGVSDLVIAVGAKIGQEHAEPETLYVEIKSPGREQTTAQKEFQTTIEKLGFEYHLWYSLDDAMEWERQQNPKQDLNPIEDAYTGFFDE